MGECRRKSRLKVVEVLKMESSHSASKAAMSAEDSTTSAVPQLNRHCGSHIRSNTSKNTQFSYVKSLFAHPPPLSTSSIISTLSTISLTVLLVVLLLGTSLCTAQNGKSAVNMTVHHSPPKHVLTHTSFLRKHTSTSFFLIRITLCALPFSSFPLVLHSLVQSWPLGLISRWPTLTVQRESSTVDVTAAKLKLNLNRHVG